MAAFLATVTAVTPAIVIFGLAVLAFCRKRSRLNQQSLYSDSDGQATQRSMAEHRQSLRFSTLSTIVIDFLGLVVSIATAFRIGLSGHEEPFILLSTCLRASNWCLISAEGFLLLATLNAAEVALPLAISTGVLLLDISREAIQLFLFAQYNALDFTAQWLSLCSQLGLAGLAFLVAISVQRRPRIFHNGIPVDDQNTVSCLNRYTFFWVWPLLDRAKREPQITFDDLPALGCVMRATTLQKRFLSLQFHRSSRLWSTLYKSHKMAFWRQWMLAIVQSIIAFLPFLCMFRALTILEQDQSVGIYSREAWVWALGIGLFRLAQQWLETRLTWLSASTLEIPIRSQISSIVFEKSLHLSDVKAKSVANEVHDEPPKSMEPGAEHNRESDTSEKDTDMAPHSRADINSQSNTEPQSSESTCQGSINLIAVDAPRVAEFSARSYILVGISMTLIISVVVLVRLIGGLSFVMGLLVPLLFTPLNTIASRRYAESQAELMKLRDEKLATIDEALRGIRHIKFAASESYWEAQIRRVRISELWQQRTVFKWIIVMRFFWISSPIFLSVFSLGTYSLLNGSLSSSTAFTALAIFGNIELAMSVLPFAYAQGADALVSSRRIDDVLDKKGRQDKRCPGSAVKFENAAVSWPLPESTQSARTFILKDLNIEFKNEKINLICGPSGSGKSLILSAIIGEAELLQGTISLPMISNDLPEKLTLESLMDGWIEEGQVAFVPQTPWIENASIRDNILAGLPYFESRYEATLEAAALLKDLETLEDGDMTEVGSQGINLSGGQRWRITFARAMYSRASILILDDILSAVDAHVGRHIFFNGLAGPLGDGRTRILATHHTALCLSGADFAISISKVGVVRRLLLPKKNSLYHDLDLDASGLEKSVNSPSEKPKPSPTSRLIHGSSTMPRAFIEDEFRARGRIQWSLYKVYIDASGGIVFWASAVSMIIISQVILLGRAWWVKTWTQGTTDSPLASEWKSPKEQHQEILFYVSIYVAISSAAAFMEAVKCAFVYLAALRASRELFERLSRIVLRSRLRWLDVTPVGRILNRFTADFALVDSRIPGDTHTLLSAVTSLAIIFLVGAVVSPYMLAVELLVLVLSMVLISKSLQGVEEIKRLEGTAKSPIFEHFRVTLLGIATIRSTGRISKYREIMHKHIDTQSQGSWASTLATQWMALRISGLGSLFTIPVTVVVAGGNVNAAAAGFILSFSMVFSKSMDEAVRRFANLQLNMNSTERIVDYLDVPHEDQEGEDVPCDWPNRGHILFRDLEARFAPELPDTLRKINAEILPGQRIGIVGRTGAGKSTMALALFRFLEAQNGSIQIDGIDISKVRLHDLRSRMSIVAQDPVVFSGSIRTNLDPVGRHTDSHLLDCLQKVHLIAPTNKEKIESTTSSPKYNLFEDLHSPVAEGGLNLSHGQRQLLSLARAILNQSRIMVMDEATSSIDAATDSLIQRAIREEFTNSTLLVIAHRLSTVADFDKILVVDHGVSLEFGHPAELLEKKGEFYKLVCESGEREKIQDMIYNI